MKTDSILTIIVAYLNKFARDIYLPTLPLLVTIFATDQSIVQFSMTIFFYALFLGRLFWPVLLERYDLKTILHYNFALFCLATIISVVWIDAIVFNSVRFIQGFTIGVLPTIFRGYLFIRQKSEKTIQVLSFTSVITVWAPAVAVLFGGFLLVWLGWRAVTLGLLVSVIISWMYIINHIVPQVGKRHSHELTEIIRQIVATCCQANFWRYALPLSLLTAGVASYLTMAPFLFMDTFDLSPEDFSLLSIVIFAGMLVGKLAAGIMVKWFRTSTIIWSGLLVCCLSALGLWIIEGQLMGLVSMISVFLAGYGMLLPVCKTEVMNGGNGLVYTSTALVGVFAGLFSAIASSLTAYFSWGDTAGLTLVLAVSGLFALAVFIFHEAHHSVNKKN